jgi:hypothetical protein
MPMGQPLWLPTELPVSKTQCMGTYQPLGLVLQRQSPYPLRDFLL